MKIKIVPLLVLAYAMFAMSGVHADPPQFKVLMIVTQGGRFGGYGFYLLKGWRYLGSK